MSEATGHKFFAGEWVAIGMFIIYVFLIAFNSMALGETGELTWEIEKRINCIWNHTWEVLLVLYSSRQPFSFLPGEFDTGRDGPSLEP